MASGPLAESSWLNRIWTRLGATFDQGRELLALAQILVWGIDPSRLIFQHLIDSSDSHDMAVDASAGIGYRYTCPPDQVVAIHRLTFWGVDAAKIQPNGFFTVAALGVGDGTTIILHDANGAVIKDFSEGDELRHHAHLGMLAGVDVDTEPDGGNQGSWTGRWTLREAGAPAQMTAGQYIEVTNNSALLAGFTEYMWFAQGVRKTP